MKYLKQHPINDKDQKLSKLKKDYLYYKCDTLEGFKDFMKWI